MGSSEAPGVPLDPDTIDLLALCLGVEQGVFPEISIDRPLPLAEFLAAMATRGEGLFGTARKDEMLAKLHGLLWPPGAPGS